jgi:hypothetical protein
MKESSLGKKLAWERFVKKITSAKCELIRTESPGHL